MSEMLRVFEDVQRGKYQVVGTVTQQDDGRKERDTEKGTHTLEQYTQFLLANRSPDLVEKKSCDAKFTI